MIVASILLIKNKHIHSNEVVLIIIIIIITRDEEKILPILKPQMAKVKRNVKMTSECSLDYKVLNQNFLNQIIKHHNK